MKLDTEEYGLHGIYKPHTAKILQLFWSTEGENTITIREAHKRFNEHAEAWGLPQKSKAAVRDSLKQLEMDGVIGHTREHSKGGWTRVYYVIQNPTSFSLEVRERIGYKLDEMFSERWWEL